MTEQDKSRQEERNKNRSAITDIASCMAAKVIRRRLQEGKDTKIPSVGVIIRGRSSGKTQEEPK